MSRIPSKAMRTAHAMVPGNLFDKPTRASALCWASKDEDVDGFHSSPHRNRYTRMTVRPNGHTIRFDFVDERTALLLMAASIMPEPKEPRSDAWRRRRGCQLKRNDPNWRP